MGMVMVFCHPHQVKIEACDALSTLHQCDLSEPSLVVVRRYSNTPYIPRGNIPFILSRCGHFLRVCFLHPISIRQVVAMLANFLSPGLRCCYHMRRGKKGWRHTTIFQRSYGRFQRRITIFPIQSLCQSPHQLLLCIWKGAPRQREGQAIIPPSNF